MISKEVTELHMRTVLESTMQGHDFQQIVVKLLFDLPYYDWVGIYELKGDELVLATFLGEPSEHSVIKVGEGVCGTAVKDKKNQVIVDVAKVENYLSCSGHTNSEIVVLIKRDGQILGQIDVDGHRKGAFDESDEKFLEAMSDELARRWTGERESIYARK